MYRIDPEVIVTATFSFLPEIFFVGAAKSIVMQISFAMPIFLLFSDQSLGRAKASEGGKIA